MHLAFIDYFVDPLTRKPLELEAGQIAGDVVESGFLRSSTHRYPIIRGIPRFVECGPNNYSKSFGYQWHKWPRVQFESENVGKPMEGHTRRMWERITGIIEHNVEVKDTLIVEIGCGPGRFIEEARSRGAKVIGIDYSDAVEIAADIFKNDSNVCICQADALNLPLKSNSIDGAYSIGVLHHTPDPEQGVHEAYRIIRNSGWFALSVYGKGGYYDFPTVQLWRRLFKALWPTFKHYPPLIYTYFTIYTFRALAVKIPSFGKAVKAFFPFVKLPDVNWSLLDTFDSVTPYYQSAHESYELFSWLRRAGFGNIEPTNWGATAYRGVKNKYEDA